MGQVCRSLGFQAAAEEAVFAACWCVVDDLRVGVRELIFYLLPHMFGLFVKGDVDQVNVTRCVGVWLVGLSFCIYDESKDFVLGCL